MTFPRSGAASRITSVKSRVKSAVSLTAYAPTRSTGRAAFNTAGVEISESSGLPEQFSCVQIPAQRYVIFPHRGHVFRLCYTVHAIWSQWFPESGNRRATTDGANLLERYGEDFDPLLGMGDIEVWLPCCLTVTNTSLAETAQAQTTRRNQ